MKYLTGKNKEQFEEWLLIWIKENFSWIDEEVKKEDIEILYKYPFGMQIGVLLSYYESLGVNILALPENISIDPINYGFQIESIYNVGYTEIINDGYESISEAYKSAFKKANELVNNK